MAQKHATIQSIAIASKSPTPAVKTCCLRHQRQEPRPKSTKHAPVPPDGMAARKKGKHMRPADQRAARRKRRK
ncbi:MAG: hypothetical protein KGI33_12165 [Thaumarchaeota archaeon]|nr:hypothetical protein [Nitrososphaerota archaeon]